MPITRSAVAIQLYVSLSLDTEQIKRHDQDYYVDMTDTYTNERTTSAATVPDGPFHNYGTSNDEIYIVRKRRSTDFEADVYICSAELCLPSH